MNQAEFGPHKPRMVFARLWRHFAAISTVTGFFESQCCCTGISFFGTDSLGLYRSWGFCKSHAAFGAETERFCAALDPTAHQEPPLSISGTLSPFNTAFAARRAGHLNDRVWKAWKAMKPASHIPTALTTGYMSSRVASTE
jgi:hypothetical protein